MSTRELVVLGSASMIPTRHRNHNGYLLRWDGRNVLFDPGEGTQRQFTFAGVSPASVTDICITHFHGDHCIGLAGMIPRLSRENVTHPVAVVYPAAGEAYFERLRRATIFEDTTELVLHPLAQQETCRDLDGLQLEARPLDHRVPTLGYRISEPDGVRFIPEKLAAAGVSGSAVSDLEAQGELTIDGQPVRLADVTEPRRGMRFAFVMDTRPCAEAVALARGANMAVIESTFLECDAALAARYGHTTAAGAARMAQEAGVDLLVLTHFSQRYTDPRQFLDEAAAIHPNTVIAEDFARFPVPKEILP